MAKELVFLSYSIDPDPVRHGEVNVFFELLIELDSARISALEKLVDFLK